MTVRYDIVLGDVVLPVVAGTPHANPVQPPNLCVRTGCVSVCVCVSVSTFRRYKKALAHTEMADLCQSSGGVIRG